MQYEVLYHAEPTWRVGETGGERAARMRSPRALGAEERYPGMFGGQVISRRRVADVEAGKLPSLRQMSSREWPVAVLDLSDEEAASGAWKVEGDRLAPVTFGDRWGAVAVALRERHPDPEAWERDDRAAREAAEAAHAEALRAHERAVEEYNALCATLGREIVRAMRTPGAELPAIPERPKPPVLPGIPESSFDRAAAALASALPKTVTHTGTGLYAVKVTPTHSDDTQSGAPAGQVITLVTGGLGTASAWAGGYVTNATRAETRAIVSHTDGTVTLEGSLTNWLATDDLDIYDAWSTVQAAHNQLVTDQGVAAFTAEQIIRLHVGTYTEELALDGSLVPRQRWKLKFEANTGDSVVWSCQGQTRAITAALAIEYVEFSGFTFSGTCTGNYVFDWHYATRQIVFRDCTIRGDAANHVAFNTVYGYAYFIDCELSGEDGLNRLFEYWGYTGGFYGCDIHDFSLTVVNSIRQPLEVVACTIHDSGLFVRYGASNYYGSLHFVQNTVYNLSTGFIEYGTVGTESPTLYLLNNIFHTMPHLFREYEAYQDFDGGPHVVIDGNCYYNVTKWLDSVTDADVTTFADWQALGYDTNGREADPLLADPAGGDFSLGTSSPCRDAGAGAGVATGINSVAFDPYRPDIGAWSSGTWARPAAPTISGISVSGKTVTVTVVCASGVTARARLSTKNGAEVDEAERSGPGTIALAASDYGIHQVQAWAIQFSEHSEPTAAEWIMVSASTSEWKKAAAAIAAHVETAAGSVQVVLPRQRFDPSAVTEFIEVAKPSFEGGAGRSGERRTGVTCQVWCVAKVGGQSRNLGRAEELADVVEDALTDADIEVESGTWLRLRKASVTGEGMDEGDMRQVVRVSVSGIYEREG